MDQKRPIFEPERRNHKYLSKMPSLFWTTLIYNIQPALIFSNRITKSDFFINILKSLGRKEKFVEMSKRPIINFSFLIFLMTGILIFYQYSIKNLSPKLQPKIRNSSKTSDALIQTYKINNFLMSLRNRSNYSITYNDGQGS